MGKPKEKTSTAKLEGDVRAHTNAIADLQRQINLLKGRVDAVEVVKAGPQDPAVVEPYRGEPDPQEPQPG